MANIFSSLHIGVSGLDAAQTQITTTGHNITNADSEHYTRQRVVQSAREPFHDIPGDIGRGTQVDTVVRVHDEFTFARLRTSNINLESTEYKKKILEEISQRFPDLQSVGIGRDLQNYFNAWNNLASNPTEGSQKINLLNNASTLSTSINKASDMLTKIQKDVDSQIEVTVNEINKYAKQIAQINKEIVRVESVGNTRANDLRDKRDQLELAMSKLAGISVFKGELQGTNVDPTVTDIGTKHQINISGFNIVDGVTYHPLKIDKMNGKSEFKGVYFEREDGKKVDLNGRIQGGKLGSALDLRGRRMDDSGEFQDGTIQKYIDNLNTFAKGIINETNNIYARSAVENAVTDEIKDLSDSRTLMNFNNDIKHGSFDVVVYNNQGQEVARKTININASTSINDNTRGNSIVRDFNSDTDDNGDNNSLNDVDDYFQASYQYDATTGRGTFGVIPKRNAGEYSVAFIDKGTNFPGIIGLNRVFEGDKAKNMSVKSELMENPHKLKAYSNPTPGNNEVANDMVQLQYNKIVFYSNKHADKQESIEGYYRYITSDLASETQANNDLNDANTAIHKVAMSEHQSVSGVNLNEELTNLIRFQSSYGAAAKIITTVEKMLDTLLTLKQ
ncbi:flagellar hook-associated protein FlgK [Campylobacter showae]|uniref:flagellar hook-associated protein FlgK n=1 Tax=Campylobacter showae TaxID=204 RepID=UPI0028D887A6|nr:flagellar hook-associated protein FlgK [Campylobacter showae]